MKIVFLVYDSRSGSTLLSSLIMKYFDNVVVTPEVGFEYLIKKGNFYKTNKKLFTAEKILKKNYLSNLNIDKAELSNIIKYSQDINECIEKILKNFFKRYSFSNSIDICIVKYGPHIFLWKDILKIIGDHTQFIFIYRDPRAVVNSKLKTIRPYYPFETFAWGGPMLAAFRWRQYIKEAEKIKKRKNNNIYEISYEDLIMFPEKELRKLSYYLNIKFTPTKETQTTKYIIPETEKKIHTLVIKGELNKQRIHKWHEELSPKDNLVVESLLYSLMYKKGYKPINKLSLPKRIMIIIRYLPKTILKIIKHYIYHILIHLKIKKI